MSKTEEEQAVVTRVKATASYKNASSAATANITPYVVTDAYFATKKEEDVYDIKQSTKSHTAKSGDYLGKIATTLGVSVTELKKQNNLKSDNVKIGQKFSVTIEEKTKKGKKVTFSSLTKASVGDEVFVIIETKDLNNKSIKIKIHQGKEKVLAEVDNAIKVLHKDKDEFEFSTKVGELANEDKVLNKEYLKNIAVAKITLSPKSDQDIKKWNDAIKKLTAKKTYLYLYIEADITEKVKYKGGKGTNEYEQRFGNAEGEWLELKPKTPIIVLDPGHGYTSGSIGAPSKIYSYKVKGKDGKSELDKAKKEIIKKGDFEQLPQYVLDDPKKWITKGGKDVIEKCEYVLVYDVAHALYDELLKLGYTKQKTHIFRPKEFITDKKGNKIEKYRTQKLGKTLNERVEYSKKIKADYYISIHADGGTYTSTGAHAIYGANTNGTKSKKLAEDIMKHYTVISLDSHSPKKDVRNLRIFKKDHDVVDRVTLVELGYLSNPKEAKTMYNNVSKMAEQLAKGLDKNITNEFN